ncbi:branched-chain amino acid aminotransferase [Sphingobacterium spiritivorum]|uniref:branched-chain amino acid aminotransferase n=1 Tax=Sphingobacterium spiritivorum TaxID=258 RepID=UPI003F77572D
MHTIELPTTNRLKQFNFDQFSFGEVPTDHLFLAKFKNGEWENGEIQPFSNFSLSPFSLCFHYGQTVFEGMKAFRLADRTVSIFRPDKHYERLNRSLERMCMPTLPKQMFLTGLTELLYKDAAWLPVDRQDIAMYIRPFVIATDPRIGVKVSNEYLFAITCTPIGEYYDKPLRVKIETEYVRAAEGSAGSAKCGGNYGGAFYPTQKANEEGFDQLIWTDAQTHQFLEEAGTMNIMMYIDNTLITPPLSGSILDGITRNSILQIARDLSIVVEERAIHYKEIAEHLQKSDRLELFGAGTAAIISPISSVQIDGIDYYPHTGNDAMMFKLKNELEGIRRGIKEDKHNWNYPLNR